MIEDDEEDNDACPTDHDQGTERGKNIGQGSDQGDAKTHVIGRKQMNIRVTVVTFGGRKHDSLQISFKCKSPQWIKSPSVHLLNLKR